MSHTKGKLGYHGGFSITSQEDGSYVAEVGLLEIDKKNARRLVAAWNACEGISTNTLEALRSPIKDISCVPGLVADIDALRAVNAELVDALEEWLYRQGTDENYMVAKARAALAKAKELEKSNG